MNHKKNCSCKVCLAADERLKELSPKRRVPAGVMQEWLEKKTRQEETDLWKGIMDITCPFCNHTVKVKISPKINCPACGKTIQ